MSCWTVSTRQPSIALTVEVQNGASKIAGWVKGVGKTKAQTVPPLIPYAEEGVRTTIELRHNRIVKWLGPYSPKQAYIVTTDHVTNDQWVYRAGPLNNLMLNGSWGRIEAEGRLFTPDETDWQYPSDISIIDQSSEHASVFRAKLSHYVDSINGANIPYRVLSQNSNSFAYQGLQALGYDRPRTIGFTPAAQAVLVK